MRTKNWLYSAMTAIGIALFVGLAPMPLSAQQKTDPAIRIRDNDLGGVVRSANGPEAGVWVIAETTGLPTPFAKIVVTDDQGRYVIPDLPKRITMSGCAVTGSSTRRGLSRSRGGSSI